MTPIVAAIALTLMAYAEPAGAEGPPTPADLAAVTERGRNLAGYDRAAWHASDAVRARHPKLEGVGGYIARKTESGWAVAFGRLDEERAKYLVAYEATQGKRPDKFTVKAFDPPRAETGFLPSAAKAIETALKDFAGHYKGEQRPYNVAALPAEKGQFWVYLFPAQTKNDVWPLGADARYLVSADGAALIDKRQLHKSVIENLPPQEGDKKLVMGIHNHVLSETPEDTDVFHVLARKPAVPELIHSEHFVFQIEPDGEAKYLGKPEDVLKKK